MEIIILAIILVALAVAGMAIKMFFKPGGKFTKTCASSFDPLTGKSKECSCQENSPDDCERSEPD